MFLPAALLLSVALTASARVEPVRTHHSLSFIENKGQIRDQDGQARNDIQFVLPTGNMNVFIGDGQLHYQFMRTEVVNAHQPGTPIPMELRKDPEQDRYTESFKANIHSYRLDVELVGGKISAPVAGKKQAYYENYYLPGCPTEGIRAYSFDKVTYRNVYPDIDWVIYVNGNKLEHEFVVGPKGDASQIRLRYKGQTGLRMTNDGSLVVTTPMGTITEKAPVCYAADGMPVWSSYKLDGNVLSYDLHGRKEGVLIDPELIWGTYYGPDSTNSQLYDVEVFDSASMYATGLTYSAVAGTIATSGSFLSTFAGFTDAFLVKFDTGGIRQWATYYGGVEGDYGTGVACDVNGLVYMCGLAPSTAGIATPGSAQPTYGGGSSDGFLAKFMPDGTRVWGTYIGGSGSNFAWSVSCDLGGKVYVSGDTNEGTGISTSTGHQPVKSGGFDWYLIQYDTMGVKQWGTYHGSTGPEWNGASCNDGYVAYLTGWTSSTTGISSPFAHQSAYGGGGSDAAIVKFFANGALGFATYYGGAGSETVGGITCDIFKNIYLFGHTNSDDNISTPTSFQPARGSSTALDAFLVKFHPEIGYRMWGTYIGGALDEKTDKSRIATDDSANIYVAGITYSTSAIASDSAWQTVFGGGDGDGFLAKFNLIGERKWCSYLGGSSMDEPRGVACFANAVFVCGSTSSPDSIATPGAFLTSGATGPFYYQGFLEKISDPDTSHIPEDTTTVPTRIGAAAAGTDMVQLSLFPNPNNGSFTLQGTLGSRTGIAEYTVTDMAGRVLLAEKTAVHSGAVHEQITLKTVAPGIYFLRYRSPEGYEQVVSFRTD